MENSKTLRLILGDQLNIKHSWFIKPDESVMYVMMEVLSETEYAVHHIQKVLGFFAAMRNFADELKAKGHNVLYIRIHDENNKQNFHDNLANIIVHEEVVRFEYQLPDEYRVDQELKKIASQLTIPHAVYDSEHFFSERDELKKMFQGKKQFLMETFYRYIRSKHAILMQDGKPLFDKWNFDQDNRSKLPRQHVPPQPMVFKNNLKTIYREIVDAGIKTIGSVDAENFIWPVNRGQAEEILDYFVKNLLKHFGTFQDAMTPGGWSLYHSRVSFAMNIKLISPREVIHAAIRAYDNSNNEISYNQLEGFVRQIIGWREYMRGVYWAKMPGFAQLNYFNHTNDLPHWYWTGKTRMGCLKHAIGQSLEYAYAHHIQRLMITGNFALLIGAHPDEVDAWYLGIYIDALDWVEITNTRGMSQFADGGIVGTKPYVSSAAYINKMSHYCDTCYYDKSKKVGEKACPFNSLYWHFYARNEKLLSANFRIGMMYTVWHKMDAKSKKEILAQAEKYLSDLNHL